MKSEKRLNVLIYISCVQYVVLCNVVTMFSKLLMVTCLSHKSCLIFATPALVAYNPVVYKNKKLYTTITGISRNTQYQVNILESVSSS